MTPPSMQTRLLASVPAMLGSWGAMLTVGAATLQNTAAWPALAIAVGLVAAVMKADERVRAYRQWKREWDSYDPSSTPRQSKRTMVLAVVIVLGVAMIASASAETRSALLVLAIGCAVPFGLYRLVRGANRRRRSIAAAIVQPVAICVAQPLYRVPTLAQIAAMLPTHCRDLPSGEGA